MLAGFVFLAFLFIFLSAGLINSAMENRRANLLRRERLRKRVKRALKK